MDPALRFSYWPRYVARVLRFRAVYRKELLGWRYESEQPFALPHRKPNEYREDPYLPVWHFSERPPWNIANRISEFPFPDVTWCVVMPDGKRVAKKLPPMLPEDQTMFKGDRVRVLTGPDQGKTGIVASVLKMRRMVIVNGLNYRLKEEGFGTIRRVESPLHIDSEVALLDPSDNEPCSAVWRFTEKGERVRVSRRTGHEIPVSASARQLDDLTDPKTATRGPKDTKESVACRVTFNPSEPGTIVNFEDDLCALYGLDNSRKPFPTYWY